MSTTDAKPDRVRRRQPVRNRQLNVPLTSFELDKIHHMATTQCLSAAALVRMLVLGGHMSEPTL